MKELIGTTLLLAGVLALSYIQPPAKVKASAGPLTKAIHKEVLVQSGRVKG